MKHDAKAEIPTPEPDALVPDPQVQREFDVTGMTIYRWDADPQMAALGWPPPIRIRKRKFRSRHALEGFKANMARRAIAERNNPSPPPRRVLKRSGGHA